MESLSRWGWAVFVQLVRIWYHRRWGLFLWLWSSSILGQVGGREGRWRSVDEEMKRAMLMMMAFADTVILSLLFETVLGETFES